MLAVVACQWWFLVLLGVAAGTLGALLGVGGGIIMVPTLVLVLALPQKAAQGVSLTVMIPIAVVSAFNYWRGSHMDVAGYTRGDMVMLAALVGIGAIIGPFIGSYVSGRLPNHTLRMVFGVFMILVGVYMLVPKPWEAKAAAETPAATSNTNPGGSDNGPVR